MLSIIKASPQAMSAVRHGGFAAKYPWKDLQVGECFVVPDGEAKFLNLQTYAYRIGKKLGRKFKVIDHGAQGLEVAYVANRSSSRQSIVPIPTVSNADLPGGGWGRPQSEDKS